jgi:HK97 family phage portal protein
MTMKDRIRDWLFPQDERQLTPAQVWGSGGIWRPISASGIEVGVEAAMKAAQGACIRLLADDISALPVDVYRKVGGRPQAIEPPDWVTAPSGNRWYTWPTYVSEVVVSLLSDGNAFVRCWPSTYAPQVLTVLDPSTVVIEAPGRYRVAGTMVLGDDEIMHIPWVTLPGQARGISVIASAEDTTGLELAARQWAGAFFRNGGTVGTTIMAPGGPETVDAAGILQTFEARHTGAENWWRPLVLTGGATKDDNTISPKEADLAPLWKHVLEEAARIYHIPVHLLASQESGASSYASVEQKAIEYVQHGIVPLVTRLERPHSLLIPGEDRYLKLNTNALLRGDTNSRAQYYNLMLQSKVMTRDEVREKEDLPYLGELGWLETPNNSGEEPQEEPRSITISDVQLRDEAAAAMSREVAAAVIEAGERTAAEMVSLQTELLAHQAEKTEEQRAALAALVEQNERERAARLEASLEPGEKRIVRDDKGRIIGTVERKGDLTTRQVIERDDVGNVISIKTVAA